MNMYSQNLLKAREILGSYDAVGQACGGLSGKAVTKWRDKGRPPRTEYTGETNYAVLIENATQGQVQASGLRPYDGSTRNEQAEAIKEPARDHGHLFEENTPWLHRKTDLKKRSL